MGPSKMYGKDDGSASVAAWLSICDNVEGSQVGCKTYTYL